MAYATQTDMVNRFGEAELVTLTDREDTGSIDATVLGSALADADAEIDGYLRGRYALPLTAVPDVLKRTACSIARYRLLEGATGQPHEVGRKAYEDARAWLRDVSSGKAQLDLDGAGDAPAQSDGPDYEAPDRVFSLDTLESF